MGRTLSPSSRVTTSLVRRFARFGQIPALVCYRYCDHVWSRRSVRLLAMVYATFKVAHYPFGACLAPDWLRGMESPWPRWFTGGYANEVPQIRLRRLFTAVCKRLAAWNEIGIRAYRQRALECRRMRIVRLAPSIFTNCFRATPLILRQSPARLLACHKRQLEDDHRPANVAKDHPWSAWHWDLSQ